MFSRRFAKARNLHSRCVSVAICAFRAPRGHTNFAFTLCICKICAFEGLGGHMKFVFSLSICIDLCVPGAWRIYQIRVIAQHLTRFVCSRRLADTQISHSRCASVTIRTLKAPSGHTKFALLLHICSELCVPGAWRTHEIHILAAQV